MPSWVDVYLLGKTVNSVTDGTNVKYRGLEFSSAEAMLEVLGLPSSV